MNIEKQEIIQKYIKNIITSNSCIDDFFCNNKTRKWGIPKRKINNNLVTFCLSGTGTYCVNGENIKVKPGRIIFISKNMEHYAFQEETDPINVFAFRMSILDKVIDPFYFYVDINNYNILNDIFLEMYNIFLRNRIDDIELNLLDGYVKSVFSIMYTKCFDKSDMKYNKIMEEINRDIDNCIKKEKNISNNKYIEKFKSEYYFLKEFKAYNNCSFKEYIYLKKMEYGKTLLMESSYQIKEIAAILGYSDQYIFSNLFKRRYGMSPKALVRK